MHALTNSRLFLFALLMSFAVVPLSAEVPPELKELDRYVGEWKSTIENQDVTATSQTEWIVQGQIVRQKIAYSDGTETLIHRGYNAIGKQHFLTLFDSRGMHWLMTGKWDASTSTFQYEGRMAETSVTIKSTFRDKDTEDWTITLLSPNGDVTEFRGTNNRVVK